jgi:serine/threonine protein phosphatase 1
MKESRYYCFPDIHGCDALLKDALSFVYEKNPTGGKIIFLGDYIDRGPGNLGVLQIVMNPPKNWQFITLLGNHEHMFIDSYMMKTRFYDFKAARDIAGFSQNRSVNYDQVWQNIDRSVIEWMLSLKVFHIEDKNVFAHAFFNDARSRDNQDKHECIWTRMSDSTTFLNSNQGLYLTHGHTPRIHGPVKSPNRINLDCGAVFYGRLVIGEYHKGIQGPVAFHEFSQSKSQQRSC